MLIPPNWIGDRSLRASLISRPVHVRDTFITTSVHPRAKILLSQGDRPYIRIRSQTLVESLLKPHRWEWFQKNWWQLITYLSKVRHFNIRAYWYHALLGLRSLFSATRVEKRICYFQSAGTFCPVVFRLTAGLKVQFAMLGSDNRFLPIGTWKWRKRWSFGFQHPGAVGRLWSHFSWGGIWPTASTPPGRSEHYWRHHMCYLRRWYFSKIFQLSNIRRSRFCSSYTVCPIPKDVLANIISCSLCSAGRSNASRILV